MADVGKNIAQMEVNNERVSSVVHAYQKVFSRLQTSLVAIAKHTDDPVILNEINSLARSMTAQIEFSQLSLGEKTAAILRYGSPEAWADNQKEPVLNLE
jgi:hypothetical protein